MANLQQVTLTILILKLLIKWNYSRSKELTVIHPQIKAHIQGASKVIIHKISTIITAITQMMAFAVTNLFPRK